MNYDPFGPAPVFGEGQLYNPCGLTDEELKTIATTKPETLKLEELLYAASLVTDLNQKLTIFQTAEKLFPTDNRAINNVGAIYFLQNKMADAKTQFEKANYETAGDGTVVPELPAVLSKSVTRQFLVHTGTGFAALDTGE